MLPHRQRVALQISNTGEIPLAARVMTEHPSDVREPESAASTVRIALWVVDVTMMHAVIGAPIQRTALQRHGAKQQVRELKRYICLVRGVGEQAVIAAGD